MGTKFEDLPRACTLKSVKRAWELSRSGVPSRVLSYRLPKSDNYHSVLIYWGPDGAAYAYDPNAGTHTLGRNWTIKDHPNEFAKRVQPGSSEGRWEAPLAAPKRRSSDELKKGLEAIRALHVQHAKDLQRQTDDFRRKMLSLIGES